MTITNGYTDVITLKNRLVGSNNAPTDNDDDPALELVIEGVSRWIDDNRGRRFYSASETRYFTAEAPEFCVVDDLLSVTTLKTDEGGDGTFENTWTSSDYILSPYNAAADSNNVRPYTYIERAVQGDYWFPTVRRGVELVGSFGYSSSTPKAVQEACILASMRLWERRNLIYGASGNADLGTIIAAVPLVQDGELMAMLNTVKRRWSQ